MMLRAYRDGRRYEPGDEGFEQVWTACMSGVDGPWTPEVWAAHCQNMNDPAYVAAGEARIEAMEQPT